MAVNAADDTGKYTAFPVSELLELLVEAIKIQDRETTNDNAESCERRVAMLLYGFGHCVVPTKDTTSGGAPMSRTLQKSYRLPDYLLDDTGGYVEAKYRSRPHKLYEDDLDDNVDVEPPVESLPIGKEAMDDYAERSSDHDTPVHLVVWDNIHDNLVHAKVSDLSGNHLATANIGGDDVYCYNYNDFEPVSPFIDEIDIE